MNVAKLLFLLNSLTPSTFLFEMTEEITLEISGKNSRNPLAELLVELAQLKLSGSLRLSNKQHKTIVYIDKGAVVFAVSNIRKHRLFEILLNQAMVTKEQLTKIEKFTNDFYLAKSLVEEGVFSKENVNIFFSHQIKQILEDSMVWRQGEWKFSSLARIKEGIRFQINTYPILYKYSHTLDEEYTLGRFKSFDEKFYSNPDEQTPNSNFTPQEAFILSRIGTDKLSIDSLKSMCGLLDKEVVQVLYRLWLGGYIFRDEWRSAFSSDEVSKINSANYQLKTSALSVEEEQKKQAEEKATEEARIAEEQKTKEAKEKEKANKKNKNNQLNITLEEYLEKIEKAATHYEILNISPDAELSEIKKAYFALAKSFHPDLFHKTVNREVHKTIQNAFTELAKAYDTLKDEEAREVYDFKLRKVLEKLRESNVTNSKTTSKADVVMEEQTILAAENFDIGYDHLMEQNYYDALPFLGRAVHLEEQNARYHAFYGKALSFDSSQYHKAETELQTAIKLDSKNTIYRIMLAELFIEIGLLARAKGELNRLLKLAPKNQEAMSMLDSLSEK